MKITVVVFKGFTMFLFLLITCNRCSALQACLYFDDMLFI